MKFSIVSGHDGKEHRQSSHPFWAAINRKMGRTYEKDFILFQPATRNL